MPPFRLHHQKSASVPNIIDNSEVYQDVSEVLGEWSYQPQEDEITELLGQYSLRLGAKRSLEAYTAASVTLQEQRSVKSAIRLGPVVLSRTKPRWIDIKEYPLDLPDGPRLSAVQ